MYGFSCNKKQVKKYQEYRELIGDFKSSFLKKIKFIELEQCTQIHILAIDLYINMVELAR